MRMFIGIHLTILRPQDGFAKHFIGEIFSTRKTYKPSVFEDSQAHGTYLKLSHIVLLFK